MAPRSSGAALLSLAGAAAGLAAAVVLASSSRSTAPRVRRARTRLRTLWLLARHNPAALAGGAASGPLEVPPQLYPAVRRDESVSDTYHGTVIKDPYRWLEDPDSPETQAFVDDQNVLSSYVLDQKRLTEMYDYPKYGCPSRQGPVRRSHPPRPALVVQLPATPDDCAQRYVFSLNTGLQAQSVLYTQATLTAEKQLLLDPNKLSSDGTVALAARSFSKDGRLFSYGISAAGSDWITGKLLQIDPGSGAVSPLPDEVRWAKSTSFAWTHDHAGFFYARYPAPADAGSRDAGTEVAANERHQLYYHRVGTPQEEDVFIYTPDNPKWFVGGSVSDDGRFLWISIAEGCDPVNKLYYVDLQAAGGVRPGLPIVKLIDEFVAGFDPVAVDGTVVTFHTNLNAPKYRLVRADIGGAAPPPPPEQWQVVVAEREHVLEWAAAARGDALLCCYLEHATSKLQLHSLASGALRRAVPLPVGSISAASIQREYSEVFVSCFSFLDPGTTYRFDCEDEALTLTLVRRAEVAGLDPDAYEMQQVFVPSRNDGTKIPLFIVTERGFKRDGAAPALLYGYGGFNISMSPYFKPSNMAFVRSYGAVFAVACMRGGGEYGERWHKAGALAQKQNVFDDFVSCAEFLCREGYTSPQRLAIEGHSNGGLLVGACVNQRPDLFGAAVAHVGVMDMLRFHRFTVGHAWCTEYGCAEHSKEQFDWVIPYSPLHNVRPRKDGGQYPPYLLLTADHDDRVVPLHTLKMVATLQHVLCQPGSAQRAPIIARIDTKSGHGAGKPTAKIIEEHSEVYGFVARAVGATWRD